MLWHLIKKAGKTQKFVEIYFVRTVFVGIVFFSLIISSHVLIESSIIFPKYLPFSQLHIAGF